tara:strand:- start:381 stop:1070 length:690 start_codon:yes stop_codon:yes gene_type:complete
MNDYILQIDTNKLKPHTLNASIYSFNEEQNEELKKSIELNGLLEPLVIDNKNTIISGHRRYEVVKQLGWENVNCRLSYFDNDIVALIELNRYRKKTTKELMKEVEILEEQYKVKRGRKKLGDSSSKNWSILNVSDKLGVSTTKLKKLKSIQTYEPSLLDDIDLGKTSVHMAYSKVREKYILNGKRDKNYDHNSFQTHFRQLLKKYKPDVEQVKLALEKYPSTRNKFILK